MAMTKKNVQRLRRKVNRTKALRTFVGYIQIYNGRPVVSQDEDGRGYVAMWTNERATRKVLGSNYALVIVTGAWRPRRD